MFLTESTDGRLTRLQLEISTLQLQCIWMLGCNARLICNVLSHQQRQLLVRRQAPCGLARPTQTKALKSVTFRQF